MFRRVFLALLLIGNLFLLYRLLVSDQGLFAYLEMKASRDALLDRVAAVEEESVRLSREIRWLKTDDAYLERIIRLRTNFLRQDEILYIFPKDETGQALGAEDQ